MWLFKAIDSIVWSKFPLSRQSSIGSEQTQSIWKTVVASKNFLWVSLM